MELKMLDMGFDYEIININDGILKVRIEHDSTTMAGKLNLKPIHFFQDKIELDNSRLFFVMYGSSSFIVKSDMRDGSCFGGCKISDLKKSLSSDDWVYLEERNFHEIKLFPLGGSGDYAFVAKSKGSCGEYPSKTGGMSNDVIVKINSGRIDSNKIDIVGRYGSVCDYVSELRSFNEDVFLEVIDETSSRKRKKNNEHAPEIFI